MDFDVNNSVGEASASVDSIDVDVCTQNNSSLLQCMRQYTRALQYRLDDDIPALCESLLQLCAPSMLRPVPSFSIVKFIPCLQQLQQTQLIDRGLQLRVESSNGDTNNEVVSFQTCSSFMLNPIIISGSSCKRLDVNRMLINIDFVTNQYADLNELNWSAFDIYVDAEKKMTLDTLLLLSNNVNKVTLVTAHDQYHLGGQRVLVHSASIKNTLIIDVNIPDSISMLQDYYCFENKYYYFRVQCLDQIVWPKACDHFTLAIELNVTINEYNAKLLPNFHLHCCPVVNLSEAISEPVSVDLTKNDVEIMVAEQTDQDDRIYDVTQLNVTDAVGRELSTLKPFGSGADIRHDQGFFINRVTTDMGAITRVSLGDAVLSLLDKVEQQSLVMSAQLLLCRDKITAAAPQENESIQAYHEILGVQQLVRISPVSKLIVQQQRSENRWQLIQLLQFGLSELESKEALIHCLRLSCRITTPAQLNKISSIARVRIESTVELARGRQINGYKITITLADCGFICAGDQYLFGALLHQLFYKRCLINQKVMTQLIVSDTNYSYNGCCNENNIK